MLNCSIGPSPTDIDGQLTQAERVTDSSLTADAVTLLSPVSKLLQSLAQESFDETILFVSPLCWDSGVCWCKQQHMSSLAIIISPSRIHSVEQWACRSSNFRSNTRSSEDKTQHEIISSQNTCSRLWFMFNSHGFSCTPQTSLGPWRFSWENLWEILHQDY